MPDLNERLRGIDQLTPPDLLGSAHARAQDGHIQTDLPTDRRVAIIALSLAIGLVAVAWVVIAIRPTTSPPVRADRPILSPAPRSDCPTELPRGDSISTQEFVREMEGYLPTWLPEGFGLMAMGGWDDAIDGSAGHGTWADERCRMVTVTFNRNWRASDPGSPVEPNKPQVGPWSVVADAPGECSNAILGPARCLEYQAASGDGLISLQMMGLDRSEGDRIALSIYSGEPPYFPTTQEGPAQMLAGFEGSLIERDGCVFMDGTDQVSLPIWPEGFSVDRGETGALQIHAEDGTIVTVVGEPMSMGGGYIAEFFPADKVDPRDEQITSVEDRLDLTIPTRCLGPDVYGFWLVGSIEARVQEQEPTTTDLSSLGRGWTELPNPPEVRSESAAKVWTGSEMLVWGGHVYTGMSNEVPGGDGFRWNPLTGRSQTTAAAPLAPRDFPAYAWTEEELLVWGGSGRGTRYADGAAYDPAADTWRTIAPSPLGSRAPAASLWTGDRFIVLGDANRKDGSSASYDPIRDAWTAIPDVPTWVAEGLWTGDEVVVRSATGPELYGWAPGDNAWTLLPSPPEAIASMAVDGDGVVGLTWDHRAFRYDIVPGSWSELAASPLPENNYGPNAIALNGAILDQQAHQVALLGSPSGSWRDITQKDSATYGDNLQIVVADGVLVVLRRNSDTEVERAFAYTP